MTLTTSRIHTLFSCLSSPSTAQDFWSHVSNTVHWTIIGSTAMSGVYTSKAAFLEATIAHLGSHVLTEPLKIRPTNVVTAATEGQAGKTTAVVEMQSIDAQCRDGMTYDMRYCWICVFDDKTEMIEKVTAYIDTDLLIKAMERNPSPKD